MWKRRRFLAFVEQLIQGHFQGPCEFHDRVEGRNSMTVLDARNVAANQPVRYSISPWEGFFASRIVLRRSPIIMITPLLAPIHQAAIQRLEQEEARI